MTWFGGVCCVPSACPQYPKTTTNRTKQVVIIKINSARLSTVKTRNSLSVDEMPSGGGSPVHVGQRAEGI